MWQRRVRDAGHTRIHHRHAKAVLAGQYIHGGSTLQHVQHHLHRHGLRVGRYAFIGQSVIGCKHHHLCSSLRQIAGSNPVAAPGSQSGPVRPMAWFCGQSGGAGWLAGWGWRYSAMVGRCISKEQQWSVYVWFRAGRLTQKKLVQRIGGFFHKRVAQCGGEIRQTPHHPVAVTRNPTRMRP